MARKRDDYRGREEQEKGAAMSNFEFDESPLKAAAVSMHELYVTLKAAGFSRRDSLELIAKILTGSVTDAMMNHPEEEE